MVLADTRKIFYAEASRRSRRPHVRVSRIPRCGFRTQRQRAQKLGTVATMRRSSLGQHRCTAADGCYAYAGSAATTVTRARGRVPPVWYDDGANGKSCFHDRVVFCGDARGSKVQINT
jgi:hypothetical protein